MWLRDLEMFMMAWGAMVAERESKATGVVKKRKLGLKKVATK
jgi:hypothetical protein